MARYFGIGGGSDASNFLTGWRRETEHRDTQAAKARQVEREDEALRGTKMRNDHELTAEDRRGENHGLGITSKGLANDTTAARLEESRNQYAQNDLTRSAEADTLGIRTEAVKSNAQSQIDSNDSESRMRPIREKTEKSNLGTQRGNNRLANLVNASQTRQLDAREQNEFNKLAMAEQEDVFKVSKTSPEEAARMINDSAIMDVDDAATVKIEEGKWRAYNDAGEISINHKTGKPVEWNINELEKLFAPKTKKGSGGGAKKAAYKRDTMAKAVDSQMLGLYGVESTAELTDDDRFEFQTAKADAESLLVDDDSLSISEAAAITRNFRAHRETNGITMATVKKEAEKDGVSLREKLEEIVTKLQQKKTNPIQTE